MNNLQWSALLFSSTISNLQVPTHLVSNHVQPRHLEENRGPTFPGSVYINICLKLGGNDSRPRGYSIPKIHPSTSFCILDFIHDLKPLATISRARYQQTLCPAKAFGGKQGSNIIFPKVNAFRILFKVWRQPFSRLGKTPQVGFCVQDNLQILHGTNKERHSLITTCPLDR